MGASEYPSHPPHQAFPTQASSTQSREVDSQMRPHKAQLRNVAGVVIPGPTERVG